MAQHVKNVFIRPLWYFSTLTLVGCSAIGRNMIRKDEPTNSTSASNGTNDKAYIANGTNDIVTDPTTRFDHIADTACQDLNRVVKLADTALHITDTAYTALKHLEDHLIPTADLFVGPKLVCIAADLTHAIKLTTAADIAANLTNAIKLTDRAMTTAADIAADIANITTTTADPDLRHIAIDDDAIANLDTIAHPAFNAAYNLNLAAVGLKAASSHVDKALQAYNTGHNNYANLLLTYDATPSVFRAYNALTAAVHEAHDARDAVDRVIAATVDRTLDRMVTADDARDILNRVLADVDDTFDDKTI